MDTTPPPCFAPITQPAVLSTPAQINAMRAHTIRIGLEYEIRNPKMRLTSKAPKCYTIVKRELGFKGSKIKVYAQYVLWMEQKGLLEITDADRAHLTALAL
jgi:hypothetical protein